MSKKIMLKMKSRPTFTSTGKTLGIHIGIFRRYDERNISGKGCLSVKCGKKRKLLSGQFISTLFSDSRDSLASYLYEVIFIPNNKDKMFDVINKTS